MLGQLLRNFQRALALQPHVIKPIASARVFRKIQNVSVHPLSIHCPARSPDGLKSSITEEVTVSEATLANLPNAPSGSPESYIVPYCANEELARRYPLIEALRTRYRLSDNDIERILKNALVNRTYRHRSLVRTLEMLCLEGVTKESFLNYPWLLTLDKERLREKLALIHTLRLRDINDFVPFLRLTLPRMRKLVGIMIRERRTVPQGNRIYYISEMIKTDPKLVAKYLSKRLFILEMPFDIMEQNLLLMIDYNVSPKNMLKDLWAFRYAPKSVKLRLERAKRAKKEKIMPWMVRAPEPILQKSFKLTLDELAVLGDKKNVVEYVAERLGFDVASTKCIMDRHPAVMRVRVTKIKEVLDYLINEAGFTRYEIANVPRILCHGLETTKKRIEELKSYGCRPSSLVIVCRSKREYDKFVKSWLETELRMSKQKNTSRSDSAEV